MNSGWIFDWCLVADSEFKVWAMFGRNRNGVLSVFNLCCKVKFSVRNYWDQFSPARLHLNTVQFMTQALCYWFLNPFSQTHSARTLFLLAWKYWKLCVRLEPYYAERIYLWTYEESLKFTVLPCNIHVVFTCRECSQCPALSLNQLPSPASRVQMFERRTNCKLFPRRWNY